MSTTDVASVSAEHTSEASSFTPPVPYSDSYWVISEVVLALITIFAIYLVVCLARYASITRCKPGREISGKKGKLLYRMCLVSVVMAVARFAADQAVAIAGWQSDSGCLVSVSVSTVFYSLSLYPVYIFLWLRQSIFYANPVLAHVLNPVVTVISYATLIVMLSGGLVLTVIYVIPDVTGWEYVASAEGCLDVANQSGFDLVPILVVCFTVSFQISLLALFMYPLLTKKTQRYRGATGGSARASSHNPPDGHSTTDSGENPHSENNHNHQNQQQAKSASDQLYHANGSNNATVASSNNNVHVETNGTRPGPHENGNFSQSPTVFYRKAPEKIVNEKKKKNKLLHMSRVSSSSFSDLMKRGRSPSANSSGSEAQSSRKSKRSKTQQGQRVIRFIRKAFILTLICVLSDVFFTVIQLMIVVPELVYLVLFDVNLMINIICIIMSFRDWPNMIVPMCAPFFMKFSRSHQESTCNGRTNVTRLPLAAQQSRLDRGNFNSPVHQSLSQGNSCSARESNSCHEERETGSPRNNGA